MSAIDDLVTNGEVTQGDLIKARAELSALRAELEQTRQCIAALEQAIREAQTQLRATTENWREECLYRADDILSQAIAHPAGQAARKDVTR